ncbi:MAG: sigma-70 family RNA polymerase sigma factor [Caldilineaceae bacterium]|nr:sigma-70 family RNA polymerase sigma factor [Caldilineaceae bacterium]
MPDDSDLLTACRAGDEQAWQALLDKYERLVYSIPLNYGLSREDAADVAQIAFTSLIQSLESLRDDSNLGGWLALVARRHTWRIVNRHKREPAAEIDSEATAMSMPGRANEIEQWELTEWLHRGLSLVGERCQALLTALYFEPGEPSYAEIARRLGMAEGSIGPTRARCLQRLRELLSQ